jgi:hypothetical protein
MRVDPPYAGDERTLLDAFLDFHRQTVAVKLAGLSDADAWRAPLPTSPLMSPIRLVRHLTWVERYWFEEVLAGLPIDWPADDPDGEFEVGPAETLDGVLAGYAEQCARSRDLARGLALDTVAAKRRAGAEVTLSWILIHMIEETARHNGHLDTIRELIDGVTGE